MKSRAESGWARRGTAVATLVLAATAFVSGFPESLATPACVILALVAGMDGFAHRGARRLAGIAVSGALLAASTVLLGLRGDLLAALAVVTAAAALFAAAAAFRARARPSGHTGALRLLWLIAVRGTSSQ